MFRREISSKDGSWLAPGWRIGSNPCRRLLDQVSEPYRRSECGEPRNLYEQIKPKRHRLDPDVDSGICHVGYGCLLDVLVADRDLVQPQLPPHVAVARRCGSRHQLG